MPQHHPMVTSSGSLLYDPPGVVAERVGVGRAQAGASKSPGGDLAKLPQRRPRRRNTAAAASELPALQGQSQDKGRSFPRGGPSRLPRAERHRPPPGGPTPRPGVAPTVTPHDCAGTISGGRTRRRGPGATGMSLTVPPASWNSPAGTAAASHPFPIAPELGREETTYRRPPDGARQPAPTSAGRTRSRACQGAPRATRVPNLARVHLAAGGGRPAQPGASTSELPARTARPW